MYLLQGINNNHNLEVISIVIYFVTNATIWSNLNSSLPQNTCRELWTIPEGAIATAANYFSHDQLKYISFGVVTQVKKKKK